MRYLWLFGSNKYKITNEFFPDKTHFDPNLENNGKNLYLTAKEALQDLENVPEQYLPNHVFTKHNPKFVKRLINTPIGKNVYKNYSDAWYRLKPDEPARTVKENHGGVFVHYAKPRVLTPRELARLQSFDDSFVFYSTKSNILKQIGNAVPPKMSQAIAKKLKSCLSSSC